MDYYLEIKVMNIDTYYNMDELENIIEETSHKTQKYDYFYMNIQNMQICGDKVD